MKLNGFIGFSASFAAPLIEVISIYAKTWEENFNANEIKKVLKKMLNQFKVLPGHYTHHIN